VFLLDLSSSISKLGSFELSEIDKVRSEVSRNFYRSFCNSAKYVIKPKWSKDVTLPLPEPYPDVIDATEEELEFCIRGKDNHVNVRPWYKVYNYYYYYLFFIILLYKYFF
jgi:hypothetical protein